MSAFDAESDDSPSVSHQNAPNDQDAEVTIDHAPPPATQSKSMVDAASATASLIATSLRALVPIGSADNQQRDNQQRVSASATRSAPSSSAADTATLIDPSLHCSHTQESVDKELAAFGRFKSITPLSALSSAVVDALQRNFMRVSLTLLLVGLVLLYLL